MSYLVFARKYRPENFKEVSGQEHVTRTLKNAIARDKVGHAYLFSGPRGVGKTSIARIFSKALNCTNPQQGEPCCECQNCTDIKSGRHLAVREIDGASHNSVDNVRELIESFRSLPPPNVKYNIYIIDEVHMLSTQAFNALLKSLEEPPPQTIFILATTEPHKVLDTVISRCQRFDFRAMSQDQVAQCLSLIVKTEKIDIEPEVIRLISRLADGSMRDAQSLLERVCAFSDKKINLSEASIALGAVDRVFLEKICVAIFKRDTSQVLEYVDQLFVNGFEPALFLKEFVAFWRELLLAKFGGKAALIRIGMHTDTASEFEKLVAELAPEDLQDLVKLARSGADQALRSNYPFYAFEALVVQMASRQPVAAIQDLVEGLRAFSRELKNSKQAVPQASARTSSLSSQSTNQPQTSSAAEKKTDLLKKKVIEPIESTTSAVISEAKTKNEVNGATRAPQIESLTATEILKRIEALKPEPMLLVHINRSKINLLPNNQLELKAGDFSYRYFTQEDRLNKFKNLLKQATGSDLSVKLILEGAQEQVKNDPSLDKQKYQEHSKVKELLNFFPGSTVSKISNS